MKLFIIKVFVLFIRVLYAPMKLRKTQNKILWLSRQSNEKSTDMLLLEKAIATHSPQTRQVFRLRRLKDEGALSLSYIFSIFGDMWQMASAKVIITDTYSIPVSCLNHKSSATIIQMWHALGAVKKFSLQSVGKAQGRDEGVSKALCMHKNYSVVFAPSEATASIYCEAFGCTRDNIKILGLPRVDVLLDGKNRKEEFLSLNPQYRGKKLVAYIPTFRNNDDEYAKMLYDEFKSQSDLGLVVSAHPLSKTTALGQYKINGDFISRDLMKLADVIITDYSACAFEGALLNKPLYFYIPDYEIYKAEQGLNTDIKKEMADVSFTEASQLISYIKKGEYNFTALGEFAHRYVENHNTDNTERMAEFICSLLKE